MDLPGPRLRVGCQDRPPGPPDGAAVADQAEQVRLLPARLLVDDDISGDVHVEPGLWDVGQDPRHGGVAGVVDLDVLEWDLPESPVEAGLERDRELPTDGLRRRRDLPP